MTKIAEIALEQYSAVASWSPIPSHPDIVALGSKESGGIGFDSTGGELRLYHFDYASSVATLLVCVKTEGRFASIDWSAPIASNKTEGDGNVRIEYPLGLVAGGMEDGSTVIWNVATLLAEQGGGHNVPEDSTSDAHVCTITSNELQGHRITALKFHPTEPWTLAVGCNSGSVVVADLSQATASAAKPFDILDLATSANHAKHNGEVTALAWNSQVSHILASASLDGSVGVWDLKTKKSWCKLQVEQGGVGCVAWNPKEGLYLVTASVDDRNPVMKVYDLGSSTSLPLTTLVGHGAGILSCSWCPHDETLLLSSSRDNRVLLWDLCTLQPVAELPPSDGEAQAQPHHHHSADPSQLFASSQTLQAQKHLRVSAVWSPSKRGLCLTTSLNRKVQVHSILALATRAGRPPKWIRPAGCCVSTFFGGGVVRTHTYGSAAPDPSQPNQPPSRLYHYVSVQTVPEQPSWIEQALQLEEELATTPIADVCLRRKRLDPTNRLWGYLSVVVQTDSRERLLSHLGFDAEAIARAAQSYHPDESVRPPDGAENGLDKLSLDDSANGDQRGGSSASSAMSAAAQDLVKKSLIVGNFEAAVDCCYKSGNLADALLIAYCGGAELWAQTQQRYLSSQQTERPYLSLLTGIVQSQWDTLVAESSTSKWQETLAILSSYAQSEDFPRLCIALGDRLEDAGIKESASLCYICALSVRHASRYWISQLRAANAKAGGSLDWKALHELVMKVTIFLTAVSSPNELPTDLAELFSRYSQTLSEQGLLALAARYCRGSSLESKILRDRLYRSRSSQRCLAELGSPPEFPFSVESVATQSQQMPSTSTSSRSSRASARVQQPSRQAYTSQQQHATQSSYVASRQPASAAVSTPTQPAAAASDALPPGWFALQDPASGMTYYANQATGETTWERPIAGPGIVENMPNFAASDLTPMKDSGSVKSTTSSVSSASKLSTKASLVSKYGDGFVTSASHPELADQYGNIGTSNPYTGVTRPGTAAAVLGSNHAPEQAPPSGPFDVNTIELEAHHAQIKNTLLALYDHLQSVSYPSEKRQLEEAKKGIDILIKNLSRKTLEEDTESKVMIMVGAIANHDIRTAATIQTALVSTDWKAHKDWLKGIKVLLQLATKKL